VDVAFVTTVLAAAIRVATPILFAALGEAVAESAGILNISVEGMMALGAFSGLIVAFWTNNSWIGFCGALLVGAFAGFIFGLITIECGADHVVTGIVLNITCFGIVSLAYQALFASAKEVPQIDTMVPISVPWLSQVSFFGRVLFSHAPAVYVGFGLIPVFWFVLNRTTWGLQVRAVGENPNAAESAGINVWAVRLVAIIVGGAMAGVGGAVLSVAQIGGYLDNITGGRGFIALAVVVFGSWNPLRIGGASLLFGAAEALQLRLQSTGIPVPHEILLALPYLLTIVVVALFAGTAAYPSAINTHYLRRGRRPGLRLLKAMSGLR
jgi:simple sugar transport system permease protein